MKYSPGPQKFHNPGKGWYPSYEDSLRELVRAQNLWASVLTLTLTTQGTWRCLFNRFMVWYLHCCLPRGIVSEIASSNTCKVRIVSDALSIHVHSAAPMKAQMRNIAFPIVENWEDSNKELVLELGTGGWMGFHQWKGKESFSWQNKATAEGRGGKQEVQGTATTDCHAERVQHVILSLSAKQWTWSKLSY